MCTYFINLGKERKKEKTDENKSFTESKARNNIKKKKTKKQNWLVHTVHKLSTKPTVHMDIKKTIRKRWDKKKLNVRKTKRNPSTRSYLLENQKKEEQNKNKMNPSRNYKLHMKKTATPSH